MTVPSGPSIVDIAIIGGGVAGCSLAIVMQRAGWSTIVVEREPVYKDRVRGEACHPWGVKELIELGLKEYVDQIGGVELPIWTVYRGGHEDMRLVWNEAFPGTPPELGFSHPDLQEALLRGARDAGAWVYRPALPNVVRQGDDWVLQIKAENEPAVDVRARFLVAADGKNGATRKLWDGHPVSDTPSHSFGGVLITGIDLPQDSAHQGFHDCGFAMLFPQGKERWRLYLTCPTDMAHSFVGADRIERFLEFCAQCFPKDVFNNVNVVGPLAFFPNSHVRNARIDGPGAVAIGDAAGAGDPSQGHGNSLVWRDIRVLRDLLLEHHLTAVPALFAAEREKYEHILRTHAAWVAPLIVGTDQTSLDLQAQVARAREEDPSALGFAGIFANGPDGLPVDATAREKFFGEHLTASPIRVVTSVDK